jgi:peptide deformylase
LEEKLLLEIRKFPDKVLREKATKVDNVDEEIKTLVENMFETMYEAPGIGLAAPQVGVLKRLFVVDVTAGEDKTQQLVFINPEITEKTGEEVGEEGCLSVPGEYENVKRFALIKAKALDIKGEEFEIEAEGLLARAIQHELDHLDGKLFIDKLSSLKREMLKKRIKKKIAAGEY